MVGKNSVRFRLLVGTALMSGMLSPTFAQARMVGAALPSIEINFEVLENLRKQVQEAEAAQDDAPDLQVKAVEIKELKSEKKSVATAHESHVPTPVQRPVAGGAKAVAAAKPAVVVPQPQRRYADAPKYLERPKSAPEAVAKPDEQPRYLALPEPKSIAPEPKAVAEVVTPEVIEPAEVAAVPSVPLAEEKRPEAPTNVRGGDAVFLMRADAAAKNAAAAAAAPTERQPEEKVVKADKTPIRLPYVDKPVVADKIWVAPEIVEDSEVPLPVERGTESKASDRLAASDVTQEKPSYLPPESMTTEEIIESAKPGATLTTSDGQNQPRFHVVDGQDADNKMPEEPKEASIFARLKDKVVKPKDAPVEDAAPEQPVVPKQATVSPEPVVIHEEPVDEKEQAEIVMPAVPVDEIDALPEQPEELAEKPMPKMLTQPEEAPREEKTTLLSLFKKIPGMFRKDEVPAPAPVMAAPVVVPEPVDNVSNKAMLPVEVRDLDDIAREEYAAAPRDEVNKPVQDKMSRYGVKENGEARRAPEQNPAYATLTKTHEPKVVPVPHSRPVSSETAAVASAPQVPEIVPPMAIANNKLVAKAEPAPAKLSEVAPIIVLPEPVAPVVPEVAEKKVAPKAAPVAVPEPKIPEVAEMVDIKTTKPAAVTDEQWDVMLKTAKDKVGEAETADAEKPEELLERVTPLPVKDEPVAAPVVAVPAKAPAKKDESLVSSVMEWMPTGKKADATLHAAPAASQVKVLDNVKSSMVSPSGTGDLDDIAVQNAMKDINISTDSDSTQPMDLASLSPAPSAPAVATPAASGNGSLFTIDFKSDEIDMSQFDGDRLAEFVQQIQPTQKRVKIVSYARAVAGEANSARRISLKRAIAIRTKMIAAGLDSARINVQAVGDTDNPGNANSVNIFLMDNL